MRLKTLKIKRVIMELTQREVAQKMNINVKSYNFKENGKSKFKVEEIKKIKEILSLTEDEVRDIFLS